MGPSRWSRLSPAKELLNEERISLLERDDHMFDCALVARELQVRVILAYICYLRLVWI